MPVNTYTAFISYRYASPDEAIAKKLHTLIETYSIPSKIRRSTGRKRMGRVFRDQEELPLTADLGGDIYAALDHSEWLIVLCSPRYLESKWCMAELDYFISLGRRDRILVVLVEGEPEAVFPQQLCRIEKDGVNREIEPLAADVRAGSQAESLRKLKQEKLRLLAKMLGVNYDDLRQRARRRRARLIAACTAAGFAALAGFLTYALVKNSQISEQRDLAVNNQMQLLIEQANISADGGNKLKALSMLNKASQVRETVGKQNDGMLRTSLEYALYDNSFDTVLTIDNDNRQFSSMVFSHNDKYLAGVTGINSACLIDASEGEVLYTVSRSDFGELDGVGFTADDRFFYMVDSWHGFVSLYDVATGELYRQYDGSSQTAMEIGDKVFPMSGGKMMIVRRDCVLIWDYVGDTREEILRTEDGDGFLGYTQPTIIELSPDEKHVAIGSHGYGTGMKIVDLSDMSEVALEKDDARGYMNLHFSTDGKVLTAVSGSRYLVWDSATGRTVLDQEFDQKNGSLVNAVPDSNGTVLLVMSTSYLGAVEIQSGRLLWEITGDSNVITEAAVSSDGKYVCASGGINGVFDLQTGEKLFDRGGTLFSHDATKFLCDTYGSDPALLVTPDAATQKTVDRFDGELFTTPRYTDTGALVMLELKHIVGDGILTAPDAVNRQARVYNSPDLRYAAHTHQDGFIEVFDISDPDSPEEINCVTEHCYRAVTDLIFNGDLMASCGGYDPRCVLFDLKSGRIRHVLKGIDYLHQCEFSADGSKIILLTGKGRDTALVYATETGNLLYRFDSPDGKPFVGIGFNREGSLVAAVEENGAAVTGLLYPTLDELIAEAGKR